MCNKETSGVFSFFPLCEPQVKTKREHGFLPTPPPPLHPPPCGARAVLPDEFNQTSSVKWEYEEPGWLDTKGNDGAVRVRSSSSSSWAYFKWFSLIIGVFFSAHWMAFLFPCEWGLYVSQELLRSQWVEREQNQYIQYIYIHIIYIIYI